MKTLFSPQNWIANFFTAKFFSVLALLSMLFLWVGCETTIQTSQVSGNTVVNPEIGYYGFRVDFPEDYRYVDSSEFEMDADGEFSIGRMLWEIVNKSYVRDIGVRQENPLIFEAGVKALSATIANLPALDDAPRYRERDLQAIAELTIDRMDVPGDSEKDRQSMKIGEHWAAMLAFKEDYGDATFVTVFCVVPGTLAEIFIFSGFGLISVQEELEQDLNKLVESLVIR
jgi:hypothetical protein